MEHWKLFQQTQVVVLVNYIYTSITRPLQSHKITVGNPNPGDQTLLKQIKIYNLLSTQMIWKLNPHISSVSQNQLGLSSVLKIPGCSTKGCPTLPIHLPSCTGSSTEHHLSLGAYIRVGQAFLSFLTPINLHLHICLQN